MSHKRLFLVAPHSYCDPKEPVRHCDRVAEAAVNALKVAAGSRVIGTPHLSDAFRKSDFDYNRPNTNGTAWREQLKATVRKIAPDFVLEVHSFPGDHSLYNSWGRSSLVLYWSPSNADFVDILAARIRAKAGDLTVSVQTPWHPVAITDDMQSLGLQHTLFEFNEDMPRENIPILAKAIIAALDELPDGGDASLVWRPIIIGIILLLIMLVIVAASISTLLFPSQLTS